MSTPEPAAGIDLDRLARSKANTAACDGPRSGWNNLERNDSRFGSDNDKDVDGIQVVREVEQDTRGFNGERGDSESTRKLVRSWI